jgi:hypothetical protein
VTDLINEDLANKSREWAFAATNVTDLINEEFANK